MPKKNPKKKLLLEFKKTADNKALLTPIEPIFILDGKEISKSDTIPPDDIHSLKVVKGKEAIEKYGIKAKDGVIEIISKKNLEQIKLIEAKEIGASKTQDEIKKAEQQKNEAENKGKNEDQEAKIQEKKLKAEKKEAKAQENPAKQQAKTKGQKAKAEEKLA